MTQQPNNPINPPQPLDEWFLKLLACPGCDARPPLSLNETKDALLCPCGRYSFPINDGLPDLLLGNATVLDAEAGTVTSAAEGAAA